MILSIDVGSRNLGVCVLAGTQNDIRLWKVIELPIPLTAKGVADTVQENVREWIDEVETVVIERQPGKNLLMQKVQHFCEMMFHCLGKHVIIMEARAKLTFASKTPWWPRDVETKKWSYYQRKSAAVKTVRAFLTATHSEFLSFFDSCPKKDDLADALLQAMAFTTSCNTISSS